MPTAEDSGENDPKPRLNIDVNMLRISKFYDSPKVGPSRYFRRFFFFFFFEEVFFELF